jgi:SAM-dependent methyltransferase
MIRYKAAALALKAFSATPATRALYRRVGNRLGDRKRREGVMPGYYPERVKRMLRLSRELNFVRDGDRVFELGTGWLHWEAITLRLFFDIRAVLYDVWDNRQLGGLKNYFRQLAAQLDDGFGLSPVQISRARGLVDVILNVRTFTELYDILGFQYVVESSGSLAAFETASFDLVVSAGVLEHIHRSALPALMGEQSRVLKPRGWAVHSIDTSDHLSHYDPGVNKKKYLECSERTWKNFWENEVQYINRVQRGEWLELLVGSGLELVEEDSRRVDISSLKVAERYLQMEKSDLECTVLKVVLRHPAVRPQQSSVS